MVASIVLFIFFAYIVYKKLTYNPFENIQPIDRKQILEKEIEQAEYKENLSDIEHLYQNGLSKMKKDIRLLKKVIKQSNGIKRSKLEYLLLIYEEKVDIATFYSTVDCPDRYWLLKTVYNDGDFITKDQTYTVDKELNDLILENDTRYKKREKFVNTFSIVIGIAGPLISLILLGIPFFGFLFGIDCTENDAALEFFATYPIYFLFIWSWAVPLLCWCIIPSILKALLLKNGITSKFNKELNTRTTVGEIGVGFIIVNSILAAFKTKGPKIKEDL